MVQETATIDGEIASSFLDQNPEHRVSSLKRKLKRKLSCGQALDQYDCKFGIRLDAQGDVVLMSDESEISSLNEDDVDHLRVQYENVQKQEVIDEVKQQRDQQIREQEALLLIEEAKLLMMKKLRHSQIEQDEKNMELGGNSASVRRLAPLQNSSGQAYKPKIAVAPNQKEKITTLPANHNNQQKSHALNASVKLNGASASQHLTVDRKGGTGVSKSDDSNAGMQGLVGAAAAGGIQLSTLPPQHFQVIQQLYDRLSQNPQQMANLIKTLPPPTGQALTELLRQYAVAQATGVASQQQPKSSQQKQQLQHSTTVSSATSQSQIDAAQKQARELTQQNISKARQQLRRELDQLVTKLPIPKAPLPDLSFVPNGGSNQPEFCYLLGLDLTVQRVLKDRQMFKKSYIPPYRCEECDTDFTPSWKAICGDNEEYHLYCERCVRLAQKRKVCLDYKALLNRAFQQIKEREKEFENHVVSGKFNVDPVLPSTPIASNVASSIQKHPTTDKLSKVQIQNNNASASSSVVTVSSLNQPKDQVIPLTQHISTGQQQPTALNLSKSAATTNVQNTLANSTKNHPKGGAPTSCSTSASTKRGVNSSRIASNNSMNTASGNTSNATLASSAAAAVANPLAALQQNPILQQQFATMAALSNIPILRQLGQLASNPMMLTALSQNPMILQQLFAAMSTQHHQQQQQHPQQFQQRSQPVAAPAQSGATAALAQLVHKSNQQIQQSHQHHRTSTASTSSASLPSTQHHSSSSNTALPAASSQQQQMTALAALMNSAATNPLIAQINQNPQLFSQLNNPQIQRIMQLYMQQMKGPTSTSGGGTGKK